MKSQRYLCPCCDHPLDVSSADMNQLILWCAYGPCPSYVANEGAEAETEAAAYADLAAKVEAEQEQIKGAPRRRRNL